MLPSLDRLAADRNIPKPGQIRMLVLAPTRELASQIAGERRGLWPLHAPVGRRHLRRRSQSKSVRTVARGLDVLVATPGRLLDLIDQRALAFASLKSSSSTRPTRCSTWASSMR